METCPPTQNNLSFIQQCQQSLPQGCIVNRLRVDAADYQTKIIQYCDEQGISYAIRARASDLMRAQIKAMKDWEWQPLINKQGIAVVSQDTCRTSFCIGD